MTSTFTDGEAYERLMGRWSQAVGVQFLAWLNAGEGKRWLDVGCGTGAFTESIIQHAAPSRVTGIDPSVEQVAFAKQRSSASGGQFDIAEAEAMPFDDGSFDVSAMALVIAFVPHPAKAVAEMVRVTAAGGIVAGYMWDLLGGGVPLQPVDRALKALGYKRPMPPSPEASKMDVMQQLWSDAGLNNIRTTQIRLPVIFESFDDFCASVLLPVGPLGSYTSTFSPDQKHALVEQLRKQMPPDSQGRISYEACANAIAGQR
jgi:SAM-dependent methyltransferase